MCFCVVGIDPGVTRTGVVIMDENKEVLAGATFHSSGPKYTKFCKGCRVIDLSTDIDEWVGSWFWDNLTDEPTVRLAIETPVMGRNVEGFALQWRLVQALINTLGWDTCIEVHNTKAKIAATGNGSAKKAQMVEASPWAYGDFSEDDVEALADAYAIGLVAYQPVGENTYGIGDRALACHKGPVMEV